MPLPSPKHPIAYFCAEFGIDSNLPTYAGGLGILAGDTLLEAAQQDFPMVGIGLLYQGKSFLQEFDSQGWQTEHRSPFESQNTMLVRPVTYQGQKLKLSLNFFGHEITVAPFQQRLGENTSLFLLSSDFDQNPEAWRAIMNTEYCCGDESQLMQQMVLGIGGMRLLDALHLTPSVLHFQEGRPIFAHWELLRKKSKIPIVYTNHTLVPDGNLIYNSQLVRRYSDDYAQQYNLSSPDLLNPGLIEPNGFSITKYGLNVADKISAVSKIHHSLCQKTWPGHQWEYVTNGIHLPRWQSARLSNPGLSDHALWEVHLSKKRDLAHVVQKRSGFSYDPNRLVLGWARRITGYKQVEKIISNSPDLARIIKNSDMPIQILVAGKAHPGDQAGKRCVQDVMRVMTHELSGHALFIPNYDISLATQLISGVDVWLNTPEYGKEACGTSGMKALSNGVINCTVADGWAAEVNWDGIGWVLNHKDITNSFHDILEHQIVPLYYQNQADLPRDWIAMMRKSLELSKSYSTSRMLTEYQEKLYS